MKGKQPQRSGRSSRVPSSSMKRLRPAPRMVIERIELFDLSQTDAAMRVCIGSINGRRSVLVRWAPHDVNWRALRKGAAWSVGRSVATTAADVLAFAKQATEAGVDERQSHAISSALIQVRSSVEEEAKIDASWLSEVRRLEVYRAPSRRVRPAPATRVSVARAQAIRCTNDRTSGQTTYEYVLQLDLCNAEAESTADTTTRAFVTWAAAAGWEGLSEAVRAVAGRHVDLRAGHDEDAAFDLARDLLAAGLPPRALPGLVAELREAFGALLEGRCYAAVPPYAEMLRRVSRYECQPPAPLPTWGGKPMNVYAGVTYMHPLGGNGTKGHLLERQALAFGLDSIRFSKGSFVASDRHGKSVNFRWSRSPISSSVALALCTHKEGTRACLARHDVPVPEGRLFANGEFAAALEFADTIGYPVVCKPAAGVRGIGVVANIQNADELRDAFGLFSASHLADDDFIVEKHIKGGDYRIIVIEGEVVAAILREPASVVGDGHSNVAELIMRKNVVRRMNPHLWPRPVKYGEAMRYQLKRAGLGLESVPAKGRLVLLSNTASLSQGGDSIDVLDEMHPSIKASAVAAVDAVPGLRYCGVDYLIEDHTRPIGEQEAGICELNAHAALGNCEYPMFGTPREVAEAFFLKTAERSGLAVAERPAKRLCLRLDVRGKVTGVGFRAWLKRYADRFGVTGIVRNVGKRRVEAVVCGPTDPVTAIAAAAVLGPRRALPTSVRTTQMPLQGFEGFEIKPTGTADERSVVAR